MRWLVSATLRDAHIVSGSSWSDGVIEADSTIVALVIGLVMVAAVLYLLRRFWSRKDGKR